MFGDIFENVRKTCPPVHNIVNCVAANYCANALLAIGASPIMADGEEEAADIAAASSAVHLNLGMPNERKLSAMMKAGKAANEKSIPVLLDLVGVGASEYRAKTAEMLMNEIRFSVVKGNVTEIKYAAFGSGDANGVDAGGKDSITKDNLHVYVEIAKDFSAKFGGVVMITGETDIVSDNKTAFCITNGHVMMSKVTGTGCCLSGITAAFLASNTETPLVSAAAAASLMGVAGETALKKMTPMCGNASCGQYIIDALYNITPYQLEKEAKYEVR